MDIYFLGNKTIYRLTLPSRIEGSFFLADPLTQENLLVIEAKNNSWVTHSTIESIKIINDKNELVKELVINDNTSFIIENEAKRNAVFCCNTCDNTFKMYQLTGTGTINIGRVSTNDVFYNNVFAKENHLSLSYENSVWTLHSSIDCAVYVNAGLVAKENQVLINGDMLYCYGLKIILISGFLFMNNPNNSVVVNTKLLKSVAIKEKNVPYEEVKEVDYYKDEDYYYNTPRIRRFIDTYELSIANPPGKQQEQDMPLLLTLGPMLTTSIISMVTLAEAISRLAAKTATVIEVLPQIITFVVTLATTLLWPSLTKKWQKKQNEKNEKIRKDKYLLYLEEKRKEIIQETVNQTTILRENLMPLSSYYEIIINKRRMLWEKKISQRDFLTIRVGTGDIPIEMNINFSKDEFVIEKDPLKEVAVKMIEEAKMLRNVPIGYSFFNKVATAIMGKYELSKPFIDNMFLQLMASHSYDELKIVIFTNEANKLDWEVYKDLPHLFSDDKSVRFFSSNSEDAKNLSSYLEQEFIKRATTPQETDIVAKEQPDDKGNAQDAVKQTFSPYYLIITDDYTKIRKLGICEYAFGTNANFGFGFVIIENRLSRLPSNCTNFLMLDSPTSSILRNEVDDYYQQTFNLETNGTFDMEKCVSVLSNIPIEFSQDLRYLPTSLTFLEMYGVGKIEQLNILNRWKLNDPTKSLRAPLGVNDEGNLIYLDLHEKYHGPHGLIAGTTGSGKSEFIITYILSMCVNYSPNEAAFILIDYKGGGLAGAFENKKNNVRLPHLAGTITNLDKNELNRTLVSIQSELTRRQSVFNDARDILGESTIDIYKYQKFFREGKLEKPMPHLFIICDEFAELKAQQPDFMDNLISAARIGRSLGVHLILATQKPSGVVNDQIWSNTKFRVCLKVAEAGDSNEIIKCPDAAEIKNAGRFYLQVGSNEIFVLGQSGWAGAPYIASDTIKKDYDRSVSFIDDCGNVIKNLSDDSSKKKVAAGGDELSNILKYITFLANKDNVRVDNLWLDAIPADIYLSDLVNKYNFKADTPTAVIGEYDDPSGQKQDILTLPLNTFANTLLFGMTGKAREMFIREIIFSASSLYSSKLINFYVFDFGSETFKIFSKFPHVGDVVFANESEKVDKLFKLISDEIVERKNLFIDYNGDYDYYCQNSGNVVPIWLVIINNYESFIETNAKYEDLLGVLVREGKRYGICFMLATSTRSGMYSRFVQNFDNTFVLDMNNIDDYSDFLGRIGNVVPAEYDGRGIFKREIAYEFQTAKFCDDNEVVTFLKEKAEELDSKNDYKAKTVPVLPEVVTMDSLDFSKATLKNVPIGIERDSLQCYYYNFMADKGMIISANDGEICNSFIKSLLMLFKKIGNTVSVLFDFTETIEDLKPLANAYSKTNMEEYSNSIIKYAQEKIVGTNFTLFIFIKGVEKYNELPSETIEAFSDIINKNSNIRMIFIDGMFSFKKMIFESWFSENITNINGIWIGNGVADQSVVKLNEYNKSQTIRIGNNMAWVCKNGEGLLVKLLECEENNEEQVTN